MVPTGTRVLPVDIGRLCAAQGLRLVVALGTSPALVHPWSRSYATPACTRSQPFGRRTICSSSRHARFARDSDIAHSYDGRTKRDQADPAIWSVFDCKACGHGFMDPQPDWSELERYYGADYEPYEADHAAGVAERDVEEARKSGTLRSIAITPGLRVMDVGCGGGAFLTPRSDAGRRRCKASSQAHMVSRPAPRRACPSFMDRSTHFVAAHPDRKFDVVTSNHVVEHHPSPVEMLKDMAKAPRPAAMSGSACRTPPHARRVRSPGAGTARTCPCISCSSRRKAYARWSIWLALRREEVYTATMPLAVRQSLVEELRYRYFIPQRLSRFFPLDGIAARMAQEMDAENQGEAIIVEAVLPSATE